MNYPEYQLYFMRINQGENFNVSFSVFIPEILTYSFKSSTLKSFDLGKIDEAVGKWVDLNDMSKEGWELVHLIHGHLMFIGLFKREPKQLQEKIEYLPEQPTNEFIDSLKEIRDLIIKQMNVPQSFISDPDIGEPLHDVITEVEDKKKYVQDTMREMLDVYVFGEPSSSSSPDDIIPKIDMILEVTKLYPKEQEDGKIIYDEISSSSENKTFISWNNDLKELDETILKKEVSKSVYKILNKFPCFKICLK